MPQVPARKFQKITVTFEQNEDTYFHPVLDSDKYRRFSIEFSGGGQNAAMTVQGSISLNELDAEGGKDDLGYVGIVDSGGAAVADGISPGLVTFELASHIIGGVVLKFTGIGENAEAHVVMSGSAYSYGAPRGA